MKLIVMMSNLHSLNVTSILSKWISGSDCNLLCFVLITVMDIITTSHSTRRLNYKNTYRYAEIQRCGLCRFKRSYPCHCIQQQFAQWLNSHKVPNSIKIPSYFALRKSKEITTTSLQSAVRSTCQVFRVHSPNPPIVLHFHK